MIRRPFAAVVALALALTATDRLHSQSARTTPFDEAEGLMWSTSLGKVAGLYRLAAQQDADPDRRDLAAIRAASIDWHVFQDAAAARQMLAAVDPASRRASSAWSERARLETALSRDYGAAGEAAAKALTAAATNAERATALVRSAAVTVAAARRARMDHQCPADRPALRAAIGSLRQAIEIGGPLTEPTRQLLDAAIFAGDGVAVLEAWRLYYSEQPPLVRSAGDTLTLALPEWRDDTLAPDLRRRIGLALAGSRLFAEAAAVLRDPCADTSVPDDAAITEVVAYAGSLSRIADRAEASYRTSGRGDRDRGLESAVKNEVQELWRALPWSGRAPAFSWDAAKRELDRRFGTVITLGETDRVPTVLLGHRVLDDSRQVEQYGRRATLHFVQIDGMASSGYIAWLTHGVRGTGGWIEPDAMYQLRPMYADGPVLRWLRVSDPARRAELDQEIAAETRRDLERAKVNPVQHFRGLELRLDQAYSLAVRDQLAAAGLSGEALRHAFVATVARTATDTSIWIHEGRHAIDQQVLKIGNSAELEFRAKLSEIALATPPRLPGSIVSPVGGTTAHGIANKRVLEGLIAWMAGRTAAVQGFDPITPPALQLDKLTPAQLAAAARSLDPIAK